MSIIRGPRPDSNFYMLDKRISEDRRLGWAARGLLIYLLGKPENWKVSIPALIAETGGAAANTGRDGIYTLLKELTKCGYARHETKRDASGKVLGCDWLILEGGYSTIDRQVSLEPHTAQPETARAEALLSTERLPRTERNQEIPSGSVELPFDPPAPVKSEVVAEHVFTPPPPMGGNTPSSLAFDLIETWNRHCRAIHKITRFTDERKRLVLKRFRDEFGSDLEQWDQFCQRVSGSDFLNGRTDRGWKPTLEWLMKPEKITNTLEGAYDNRAGIGGGSPGRFFADGSKIAPGTV